MKCLSTRPLPFVRRGRHIDEQIRKSQQVSSASDCSKIAGWGTVLGSVGWWCSATVSWLRLCRVLLRCLPFKASLSFPLILLSTHSARFLGMGDGASFLPCDGRLAVQCGRGCYWCSARRVLPWTLEGLPFLSSLLALASEDPGIWVLSVIVQETRTNPEKLNGN